MVNEGSTQNDAILEGGNAGEGGGTSHGKGGGERGSASHIESGGDLGGTVHVQFGGGLVVDNIPVATHGTHPEFAQVVHQHGDARAVGERGNGVSTRLGDLQCGASAAVGNLDLVGNLHLGVRLDEITQEVDRAVNEESTANVNAVVGRAGGNVQITGFHGDGVGEGRSLVVGSVDVNGVGVVADAQLGGDLEVSTEGGIRYNRHFVAEGGSLGNREFARKDGVASNCEVVQAGDLASHIKSGGQGGGTCDFEGSRAGDLARGSKGGSKGGGTRNGKGGSKGGSARHIKGAAEGGGTRDVEGSRAGDLSSHIKSGGHGGRTAGNFKAI